MEYVSSEGRRYVAAWLYIIYVLILAMVLIGGLTRLTGSGLSMVEWRPLMGAVPPLHEADWLEVFDKYKQFPEYKLRNAGMSLSEFKFIFAMEYGHRLLGRIIGLVFFFPLVFFMAKKWLTRKMTLYSVTLFILGGLQGVVGWFMVKSGLVDMPQVSQYRLVLHLSMAILVLTISLWLALHLSAPAGENDERKLYRPSLIMTILVGVQIVTGGFVAGLKAGLGFNTWPTMNGQMIPEGLFTLSPWFANFFENPVLVQFVHRNLAMVVALAAFIFYFKYLPQIKTPRLRKGFHVMIALVVMQVVLGIATLLMLVPVSLAAAHQMVALFVWSSLIFICHQTRSL